MEQLILKSIVSLKLDGLEKVRDAYKNTGIIPNTMITEKIKSVAALVEFSDGTVEEVEPKAVQFLDSSSLMAENMCFTDEWKKSLKERGI